MRGFVPGMDARRFILDASVALEWFLPEAGSIHAYAAAVLAAINRNDITPAVPDLWHYEMASALLTAKRSGRIGATKLKAATANLATFQPATLVLQLTAPEVIEAGLRYSLQGYDAVYFELALRLKAPMVRPQRRARKDYATAGFLGRPPILPFSREAAAFAGVLVSPPDLPMIPAIHLRDPRVASSSAGR